MKMKLAISGKGGVGKSTIAAALATLLAEKGQRVLAVDADPVANLASALGIPGDIQQKIIPISKQEALIEERTGAKANQYGQMFTLNPEVSDIAEKYALTHNGVSLLVLGAVQKGGSGCACAENTLIRALVSDLILYKDEVLIMDMEAGVEHLGRATTSGVDAMLIVVEPGQRAVDCANKIIRMAGEINLKRIVLVANKISGKADEDFVRQAFPDYEILAFLPLADAIKTADRKGISVIEGMPDTLKDQFLDILARLEKINIQR